MINQVKFISRLQRLKPSYLLTYYQKEWANRTKTILGLLFRRIIHLPLTARTIRTSILFVRVTFSPVCQSLNLHIFGPWSSVHVPLSSVRRGLPLYTNSIPHAHISSFVRVPFSSVSSYGNLRGFGPHTRIHLFVRMPLSPVYMSVYQYMWLCTNLVCARALILCA